MSEYLVSVESGPEQGKSWPVREGDRLVVGRSDRVAIPLPGDGKVSRAHAWLWWRQTGVELHDAQSTHGTFVDGQALTGPALVPVGGAFRVGDTVLRVSALEALELDDLGEYRSVESLGSSMELSADDIEEVAYPGQQRPEPRPVGAGELRREDPARVGPYQTIRVLGRGQFGAVYEALHGDTLQRVALKVIRPEQRVSDTVLRRFRREQNLLRSIVHPNVALCVEADVVVARVGRESEPIPYIAMELLEGGSVEQHIHHKNSLAQVLLWGADIFRGLAGTHAYGIVHRDVKPGNVLLTHRPSPSSPSRAKLSDFGLAKVLSPAFPTRTATHEPRAAEVHFTVSPEQIENFGNAGFASDLYAAATVLYLLLSGGCSHLEGIDSFTSMSLVQIAHSIRDGKRVPLQARRPEVPEEVAFLIDSLISADDKVRSTSHAEDLAERLELSLAALNRRGHSTRAQG